LEEMEVIILKNEGNFTFENFTNYALYISTYTP
jgi:hypothetical protein